MANRANKVANEYLKNVKDRLGHLPEDERSAILDNLETQIYEALNSRCKDNEPTPDDVKAVLAEMDSPEAFASVSLEETNVGPRPVVGKVALYISIVGIILSIMRAILYQSSHGGTYLDIIIMAIFIVPPSQILALVVAVFSRGDRLGRIAIIISISCLVLWLPIGVSYKIVVPERPADHLQLR